MRYEQMKSIVLTLLVVISIVITFNLWTYQPDYEPIEKNDTYDIAISDKKEIKDLILPYKVLYHQADQTYGTNSDIETNRIMKELATWNLSPLTELTDSLTPADFMKLVHGQNNVEIIFPDIVPFSIMRNVLKFEEKALPANEFNRIIISMKEDNNAESGTIYFVNYDQTDKTVYQATVSTQYLSDFYNDFFLKARKYPSYFRYDLTDSRAIFLPEETTELYSYKYYIDLIDIGNFRNALFSNPSVVRGDMTEYTDGTSIMKIHSESKTLSYINPSEEAIGLGDPAKLFQRSVDYVNEHGGWTDKYRYFSMSSLEQKIVYRLFLQGYPVFNDNNMAEISQIWGNEKVHQYQRPYFSVFLGLPSEPEEIQLTSGYTALDFLLADEFINKEYVEDIAIGYKLSRDPQFNDQKVIIFEPAWYYKYSGLWIRLPLERLGGR